jgi:hypothetical protein
MMQRARVLVSIESTDELKLVVKLIRVVDEDVTVDDLMFEWFNMVGFTKEDARRNCIESIAFFLLCRPELYQAIIGALDDSCANEVKSAIKSAKIKGQT